MSRDLTRWIEEVDACRFGEAVAFERGPELRKRHFTHLGNTIAHLPTWLRHSVRHDTPSSSAHHNVTSIHGPTNRRAG
jgi:hypothetical protein